MYMRTFASIYGGRKLVDKNHYHIFNTADIPQIVCNFQNRQATQKHTLSTLIITIRTLQKHTLSTLIITGRTLQKPNVLFK